MSARDADAQQGGRGCPTVAGPSRPLGPSSPSSPDGPNGPSGPSGCGWPGRELCQHPDIALRCVSFPPGPVRALCVIRGAHKLVLLDRDLVGAERRAALTHELVHLERGTVPRGAPAWIVSKEERHVDRIAAGRLVPAGELRRFVDARTSIGAVSASDIAEQFEVPLPVAIRACDEMVRA